MFLGNEANKSGTLSFVLSSLPKTLLLLSTHNPSASKHRSTIFYQSTASKPPSPPIHPSQIRMISDHDLPQAPLFDFDEEDEDGVVSMASDMFRPQRSALFRRIRSPWIPPIVATTSDNGSASLYITRLLVYISILAPCVWSVSIQICRSCVCVLDANIHRKI
ncbi:hypothetical protein ACP275_12G068200 [Erythranthe tilingii]